jgi:hypothetical protein
MFFVKTRLGQQLRWALPARKDPALYKKTA